MGPAGMGQPPTAPRVLHSLGKQPGKNRVCSLQCPGPAGPEAPICSRSLSEHRVPRSTSVPGADLRHREQYKKPCPGVLVLGSAVHRASKLALNLPDHRDSQEPAVPKTWEPAAHGGSRPGKVLGEQDQHPCRVALGLALLLAPWLQGGVAESTGPGLNPELGLLRGLQ